MSLTKYLDLPLFSKNRIAIKFSRLFFTVSVYQDGKKVIKEDGKYCIENDLGQKKYLKLKRKLLDPIPQISFDDEEYKSLVFHSLNTAEKSLSLLPLILFILGGVNIITFLMVYIGINLSYWTMYKYNDTIKKVLLCLFVTLCCSSIGIYLEIIAINYLRSIHHT